MKWNPIVTPFTGKHRDQLGYGNGCFNCARLKTPCDVKGCSESEQGEGFWCPENCASIVNEVEEKSIMKTKGVTLVGEVN